MKLSEERQEKLTELIEQFIEAYDPRILIPYPDVEIPLPEPYWFVIGRSRALHHWRALFQGALYG